MSKPPIELAPELAIDLQAETQRICDWLPAVLARKVGRRGVVIGLSGGVDSSVCAALAVRSLGADRVFGLLMPERDSSDSSQLLAVELAASLGIRYQTQNISAALTALGCYDERDAAIRQVFPAYRDDWKSKIVIAGGQNGGINFFRLVVQSPSGELAERRLPLREYLQIVAATNYKQRVRKSIEYFHADRLNYAVLGTPNRLEMDQGFFVKNGDGAADLKPIAHLYKTQVYALARHLGLPSSISGSTPTSDTYSLAQGQDEFYFVLPYQTVDRALRFLNLGRSSDELAQALAIPASRAEQIYTDLRRKRRSTQYQHLGPQLLEPIFSQRPLWLHWLARLEAAITVLPDKHEETADGNLRALWHTAAGKPMSFEAARSIELPELGETANTTLSMLVEQRIAGVPLAHLTQRQRFMGLEMVAGPAALIPRRESELLAQAAIELVQQLQASSQIAAPQTGSGQSPERWVAIDVCTGSANIAAALAAHVAAIELHAADLSPEAIVLARCNLAWLGLTSRVHLHVGDLFAPLIAAGLRECAQVVTCNPPYVSSARVPTMAREISQHEPPLAFDGGPFGVGLLRRVIREAPAVLAPGGWLLMEVGLGQGPSVIHALHAARSYAQVSGIADQQGQIRVVKARRL